MLVRPQSGPYFPSQPAEFWSDEIDNACKPAERDSFRSGDYDRVIRRKALRQCLFFRGDQFIDKRFRSAAPVDRREKHGKDGAAIVAPLQDAKAALELRHDVARPDRLRRIGWVNRQWQRITKLRFRRYARKYGPMRSDQRIIPIAARGSNVLVDVKQSAAPQRPQDRPRQPFD